MKGGRLALDIWVIGEEYEGGIGRSVEFLVCPFFVEPRSAKKAGEDIGCPCP